MPQPRKSISKQEAREQRDSSVAYGTPVDTRVCNLAGSLRLGEAHAGDVLVVAVRVPGPDRALVELSTNSVEKFSGAPAGSVAVRGAPALLHDRGLADVDSGTPPLTVTFSPG